MDLYEQRRINIQMDFRGKGLMNNECLASPNEFVLLGFINKPNWIIRLSE